MVLVVGPDDIVKAQKVQVGELRYGLRVIRAGLNPTDRVIIGGPPVAPGAKVLVKEAAIAPLEDDSN